MIKAIVNGHIFDGDSLLSNYAVLTDGEKVVDLIPQAQLPKDTKIDFDLDGAYLVPGYIDLQVNGGGGVLFNSAPTAESIRLIGEAHRQFGTTGFLPTLITDSFDVMRAAVAAVDEAIEQGVPGVLGIHLEGPFLNAERKGTHDKDKFCILDDEGFEVITSLSRGKTLITIAPELTSPDMIRQIADTGVVICAGHTGADYDQTRLALDSGLAGFTHLYNAMTPMQSREPGMVGAALEDSSSWFGIIADGIHVHPASFKVAVTAKQGGGALLVTDAMPTVGALDKSFELNGETIRAENGGIYNAEGSLAGSDLDMNTAVNNAAEFAQIDWLEAVRMASLYPAKALGIDNQYGYIKPDYLANFVALDNKRNVVRTWINGQISEA